MAQIKTVPTVLKRARALLAAKGWTQGSMAVNANGEAVAIQSRRAASFCALGAVHRVTGNIPDGGLYSTVRRALMDTAGTSVVAYNDAPSCTKSKVLRLFDRTIARLQKTPKKAATHARR